MDLAPFRIYDPPMVSVVQQQAAASPRPLTSRQRLMAGHIARGMTAVAAYERAGYRGNAYDNAHHITEKPRFQKHLTDLLEKAEAGAVMTRQERLESISTIARREMDGNPRVALMAMDLLNKMMGDYELGKRIGRAAELETPVAVMVARLRVNGSVSEGPPARVADSVSGFCALTVTDSPPSLTVHGEDALIAVELSGPGESEVRAGGDPAFSARSAAIA